MGGDAGAGTPGRGGDTIGREAFVEEIGLVWESAGSSRMDGRVIAYLLITDVPYVSSAELAGALRVSAGSVSLSTRRLVEAGFIRRHAVPGERSHYFRVDDDVWGSFLAGERRHLDRQEQLAEQALAALGPDEEAPRRRLTNMRDYMRWVRASHQDLLSQWKAYRAEGGAPAPGPDVRSAAPEVPEGSRPRRSVGVDPALARRLLPDALWSAAESLLGGPAPTEREALTAVVYVLTSGCGWQQLPAQFPVSHSTAHRRFTAWSREGFWARWLETAKAEHDDDADLAWCALVTELAHQRRPGGTG